MKKKNTVIMDIEEYKNTIVEIIKISSGDFGELCNNIGLNDANLIDYFVYLNYIVYIVNVLLKKKYDSKKVDELSIRIIKELINQSKIEQGKKQIFFDTIKDLYDSIFELNLDSDDNNWINKLAKHFQDYLELGYDAISNSYIINFFTSFIIYHIPTILDDSIIVKELNK